jgi:hypothetical protein
VDELVVVGVPEIAPVEVENESPAGRFAEMDQEVTAPPLVVGVTVVMVVSFVKVNELGVYVMEDGATSLT